MVVTGPRPYRVLARRGGVPAFPHKLFLFMIIRAIGADMLIRTHKAWERRPCPATSSPFATTSTSGSWGRATALPCRPSRVTARPAVGAPAGSRGPLALGRPCPVDLE